VVPPPLPLALPRPRLAQRARRRRGDLLDRLRVEESRSLTDRITEHGLAISGSWFTKHFQALLLRAGLPTMRLHDMRHGAGSLLVDAGANPCIAQELLRHAPRQPGHDWSDTLMSPPCSSVWRPTCWRGLSPGPSQQSWNQSRDQSRTPRTGSPGVGQSGPKWAVHEGRVAPAVGLEPTTWRLTAARSTD